MLTIIHICRFGSHLTAFQLLKGEKHTLNGASSAARPSSTMTLFLTWAERFVRSAHAPWWASQKTRGDCQRWESKVRRLIYFCFSWSVFWHHEQMSFNKLLASCSFISPSGSHTVIPRILFKTNHQTYGIKLQYLDDFFGTEVTEDIYQPVTGSPQLLTGQWNLHTARTSVWFCLEQLFNRLLILPSCTRVRTGLQYYSEN